MLPILCASQGSNLSLPKWIKYEGIDAVVISIQQMDTLVKFKLERDLYKTQLKTKSFELQLKEIEIDELNIQLDFSESRIANQDSIIKEKNKQINQLTRGFWDKFEGWIYGIVIGFIGAAIVL